MAANPVRVSLGWTLRSCHAVGGKGGDASAASILRENHASASSVRLPPSFGEKVVHLAAQVALFARGSHPQPVPRNGPQGEWGG
jgi:hypothetical protein